MTRLTFHVQGARVSFSILYCGSSFVRFKRQYFCIRSSLLLLLTRDNEV